MDFEQTTEDRLRRQAIKRMTVYMHPELHLEHQPINARECQQLRDQLRQLVRQKVETAREQYNSLNLQLQYQKVYEQFVTMTGVNQARQQKICKDIRQMHEMADMLLHPPNFSEKLSLYSNKSASASELDEYDKLYKKYEKMYQAGYQFEQYEAQEIIRKAKEYYLRDRS